MPDRNALRKKFDRRAANLNKKKPTPSQRHSEQGRKKLQHGIVNPVDIIKDDCRGCEKYPCNFTLSECGERFMIKRCVQCGQKIRYRVLEEQYEKCPVCQVR